MNKIILLLLVVSSMLFAGEEEGSGTSSNETVYQLICAPVAKQDNDCVVVKVNIDN